MECACGFPETLTTLAYHWEPRPYEVFHIWWMDGVQWGYVCKQRRKP